MLVCLRRVTIILLRGRNLLLHIQLVSRRHMRSMTSYQQGLLGMHIVVAEVVDSHIQIEVVPGLVGSRSLVAED